MPITSPLERGRVYFADLGGGRKPWVVVSNNQRNRALEDALVVRITTTDKYEGLASVQRLPEHECVVGLVRADTLTTLYPDEVEEEAGGLSRVGMEAVEAALRGALGLT